MNMALACARACGGGTVAGAMVTGAGAVVNVAGGAGGQVLAAREPARLWGAAWRWADTRDERGGRRVSWLGRTPQALWVDGGGCVLRGAA
jgi:hypothetical protein